MKFDLVADKNVWNQLVGEKHPNQFLQSWEWGEFQKALGREVRRFKIDKDDFLVSLGQIVRYDLPLGFTYLYLPRGPLATGAAQNHAEEFLRIFQREVGGFFASPIFVRAESADFDFSRAPGFRRTRDVQPSRTLILNLEKDEDELLQAMHQKTRYNMRLAVKHEVGIRKMEENEFEKFWNLIQVTTARDKFRAHPKSYYEKMIQALGRDMCQVWFAEYKGEVIAANLMIFWGDTVTYVHGASSSDHRNVMAPHLLHWEIIKRAKELGYKFYDFWGVAPKDEPAHPWAGISRFKRGFGGEEVSYAGTFDWPINKFWYLLYRLRTGR